MRRGAALHDLGIIEDGAVLIRDGVITQVGSTRRVENLKEARGALEIEATRCVVMPGFVDAHIELNIYDPVTAPAEPPKRKVLSKFYEESLALTRACLQHGTLTAEVKANAGSGHLEADAAVLRQLAKISSNPIALIRTWRLSPTTAERPETIEEVRQAIELFHKKKLMFHIEIDSQFAESAVLDSLLVALRSKSLGVKLLWQRGPAERLASLLDYLCPQTVCCPSELNASEISVLTAAPSTIVFSPCQEVSQGCPAGKAAQDLAGAGAGIALSTGFHFRDSPSCSMQMALSFAVLHLRLTIEQAITAATMNAAYAVGAAHRIGSIEVGKSADLLVLTLPDYREIPRQYGINHVGTVIREGNVVINRTRSRVGAF